MEEILRAIRGARARLVVREAVRVLPWTLLAVAPALAWFPWALGLAPLAALIVGLARRPSMRTAALALDRAAGLRERLCTALLVAGDSSEAAGAVIRDAQFALKGAHSGVPLGRPKVWPAALGGLIVLGCLFAPRPESTPPPPPDTSVILPAPVRREEAEKLRRRAFELEKKAQEASNPELRELAKEMRKVSDELRKNEMSKNEAMAKLSSLEEKVRETREKISQRQPTGPRGSMSEVQKAVEKMQEQLKSGDEASREQAAEELAKKLQEKLGDSATGERLEELLKEGNLEELAEQLENLEQMLDDLDALGQLDRELAELEGSKGKLEGEGGT